MKVARYSLILLAPTVERLDVVVAGAVFQHDGAWDVRVTSSVQKMKAINPDFPQGRLAQTGLLIQQYAIHATSLPELRGMFEGARLGLIIDQFEGAFSFHDQEEYQQQVIAVLTESVEPPSFGMSNSAPISRRRNVVRRNLRDHFKKRGLWSRKESDIENHRVVEQFSISADLGIIADFALKNGAMHITETIDFEVQSLKAKRLEAQATSFVMTEAVKVFGADTKRYVVAAGITNPDIKQSLLLLSEHARVFSLESAEDMETYVELMAVASGSSQRSITLP